MFEKTNGDAAKLTRVAILEGVEALGNAGLLKGKERNLPGAEKVADFSPKYTPMAAGTQILTL